MEEIGRRLREAREAKGITTSIAEDQTKIRRKYIEALEAGREADLPGEAYLKGFLRTYGNYLELDGPALVEEYKAWREEREAALAPADPKARGQRKPEPAVPREAPKPVERPVSVEPPGPAEQARRELARPMGRTASRPTTPVSGETGKNLGIAVLVVAVLALLGIGGWIVAGQLRGGAADPPQQGDQLPVAEDPAPDPEPAPEPEPEPPVQPAPTKVTVTTGPGQEVHFTVEAEEIEVRLEPINTRLWLRATVNGVETDREITRPETFRGNSIRLRVGHLKSVNLYVNGERIGDELNAGPYTLIFKRP